MYMGFSLGRGSSPRMRGALSLDDDMDRVAGIIPADAGSTHYPYGYYIDDEDHPRGCGEHPVRPDARGGHGGSSPRMRGAPQKQEQGLSLPWIIPADAGSTIVIAKATQGTGDHPRGCGEHMAITTTQFDREGSSPRMRGARR